MSVKAEALERRMNDVSEVLSETGYNEFTIAARALSDLVASAKSQGSRVVLNTGDNLLGVRTFFMAPNAGGIITHEPQVLRESSPLVFNKVFLGREEPTHNGLDTWTQDVLVSDGLFVVEGRQVGKTLKNGGVLSIATRQEAEALSKQTAAIVKKLIT